MNRIIELKKRRAQQLVEFLLVAPFIIILLGILVEYAYALNVNMSLTQGLKAATANMYYDVKPGATAAQIKSAVLSNLTTYLDDNKIAVDAQNSIAVNYVSLGNTTVFTASYKYIPAFTLPMMYVRFLPSEMNFLASSAVPTAFINTNTYDATITTAALNNIWSTPTAPKGVYNVPADQGNMIFLVPTATANLYDIKDWGGNLETYTLNSSDGELYTSCATTCVDSGKNFKTFYALKKNIIFVHDSGADGWANIVNRAVGMEDSNGKSRGNYDNLNVSLYNSDVVSTQPEKYSVSVSGGKVFTYVSSPALSVDDISKL